MSHRLEGNIYICKNISDREYIKTIQRTVKTQQ